MAGSTDDERARLRHAVQREMRRERDADAEPDPVERAGEEHDRVRSAEERDGGADRD
jgi:hypothetical protein